MCQHDGARVAAQRVFEQSCEFTVPVVDITAFVSGAQCVDDVAQCEQGAVDGRTFFQALALVLKGVSEVSQLMYVTVSPLFSRLFHENLSKNVGFVQKLVKIKSKTGI